MYRQFAPRIGKRSLPLAAALLLLLPLTGRAADEAAKATGKTAAETKQAAKPPAADKTGGGDKAATPLPLTKVVMFSSGVGYFEHDGNVTGNAHVALRFNINDINDLLKSMVLQDMGGGKISTVNYESKDPITKTLKTFAIDLTEHPTLADLLKQIRGETVEVDAPQPIVGKIIGVERHKVRVGKDETVDVDYLDLLTADGLRSISLETVSRIKLTNAKLNADLQQALAVLATGHDKDKKTVTLHFVGKGKRAVRVGYIQESPLWKTSYRLVLKDKTAPFLQGWAIVENTTEQDWKNVDLTLDQRPPDLVHDGPLSAVVRPAAGRRPGTLRLAPSPDLRAKSGHPRRGVSPQGRHDYRPRRPRQRRRHAPVDGESAGADAGWAERRKVRSRDPLRHPPRGRIAGSGGQRRRIVQVSCRQCEPAPP